MRMNIVRNKMGKKAVAALLAVMIMSAPVTNVSFASEGETGEAAAPTTTEQTVSTPAPVKPDATSHKDNDKVHAYNAEVKEYNDSAAQYNKSVDEEYEAAVEETNRQNAIIDQHNAEEQQRVNDAKERNAQAQAAADEANRIIDEENAKEKESVDQHNKSEDEKAEASKAAAEAAKKQNEEAEKHNAEVDKYNADMKQYYKDLDQYSTDLAYEKKIQDRYGYTVEQYNNWVERDYNGPARKSVEKNASAKEIKVSDTYTVTEAAEKSGVKVKVYIEHNFQDVNLSYTEEFEIDANDIIKVTPMTTVGESTSPGYATLYYNTDDQHKMGYWMEAYSSVGSNAKYNNYGWDCGDTHEISYKDGKNHASDKEEIYVEYYYMWNQLREYSLFNIPVEPTMPTNPGEAKAIVEVPEIYNPVYKTFVEKEYVKAELETIVEADIWEKLPNPVKKAYISLLDYMDLFDVPEAADTKAPAAPAASASKSVLAAKNASPAVAAATITSNGMPMAAADTEAVADNEVPMTIMDEEAPQAPAGAWALINLLSALLTALLSLIMMARYFRARREENEETGELEERNRKGALRLSSLIPAIGAIAAFILTENMANPMVLTDRWTLMMVIILAIQTGVAVLVGKKDDKEEKIERA